MTDSTGKPLVLGEDGGGPRWFLDGKAVYCGEVLELLINDGRWLPVRFEQQGLIPILHVGLDGGSVGELHVKPEVARLRWPR